jgi:hypothetical protein
MVLSLSGGLPEEGPSVKIAKILGELFLAWVNMTCLGMMGTLLQKVPGKMSISFLPCVIHPAIYPPSEVILLVGRSCGWLGRLDGPGSCTAAGY